MATLVLSAVGTVVGGLFGPVGAIVGRAVGAIAGGLIDNAVINALTPGETRLQEGPRLDSLQVTTSTEGAPIPQLYGTMRIGGQIIWATDLIEEVHTTTDGGGGGKGFGGGGGGDSSATTEYLYYANFAVGLCEGPVAEVTRIWADGKPLDLSQINWRFYPGDETQGPDSLIVSKQGSGNAPAYRGLAYVVFERLPLKKFGNRIPQLTFEVRRPVDGALTGRIRAVDIIPGAGEFFCDWKRIYRDAGDGKTQSENVHAEADRADWTVSMDQMQRALPQLQSAALVVTWFGTDLRCGHCQIRPGVEYAEKSTFPEVWKVAGIERAQGHVVSRVDGRPAYGGTPSDASVRRAIADLKSRGLKAVFYPFIMMDIAAGNTLPDPYTGATGQPAYPWRGRITCDPAPGRPGTPDKTTAVQAQVDAFIGTAQPSDFSIVDDEVVYSGPAEWSYRRFILHYATLCVAAGGVDAFLIGSELRGLTRLRRAVTSYSFVQALKSLAADVKSILGPATRVSYAANWDEYGAYHPNDGSNDVVFPLDGLWADANIDFISIDNYMPLSDWRDGQAHLDAQAGWSSIYDVDYLKANIAGGEYYDWYYASSADRDSQTRTPISDTAHGEHWVFRVKDIKGWWSNAHHERPGGVRAAGSTAWQPQSKPVWFTEIGCPAVDKGTNQPNVFYDPKSSESFLPYYSTGQRDDFMQRQYLRAMHEYWQASGSHNPVSSVYGGPMVDGDRIFIWTWDARPWPQFPGRPDIWTDTPNWRLGHWLNGRLIGASVNDLIAAIMADWGLTHLLAMETIPGQVAGYVIDRPMSARAALEQLAEVFAFDARESADKVAFHVRNRLPVASIDHGLLVEEGGADDPLFTITRDQASERPRALKLSFFDPDREYNSAAVTAARAVAGSGSEVTMSTALAMPQEVAAARADTMLAQRTGGAEELECILPPDHLALEVGDVVSVTLPAGPRHWRVMRLDGALARRAVLDAYDPAVYEAPRTEAGAVSAPLIPAFGPPALHVLDIPPLHDGDDPVQPRVAVFADPWPGTVRIEKVTGGSASTLAHVTTPAVIGELLDDLPAGPLWRYDRAVSVRVRLYGGQLASVTEAALLAGANAAAVGDAATGWEVIQFMNAVLEAPDTWRLSMLLRGQRGSEPEMAAPRPAGGTFVLLDAAVVPLPLTAEDRGQQITLKYGPASRLPTDVSWAQSTFTFTARAARPFAPVHLRARRLANGDIRLSWVRRTRSGGDPWSVVEVPLAEEAESYRLEIMDGATVKRAFDVTTPEAVWTAAQQAADYPSGLPVPLNVRVAQKSARYGVGACKMENLHV